MAWDTNDTDNLWRWLSLSEDSIFLLDGLNTIKDLLIPAQDEIPPSETFEIASKSGGDDIPKLVKLIRDGVERTNYNAHVTLAKYRIQALYGLWKARRTAQLIKDEQESAKKSAQDLARIKRGGRGVEGLQNKTDQSDVASELTLMMLFPLIESTSQADPNLCSKITQLLTEYFKQSLPMSVKGPTNQLDAIEDLLVKWIHQGQRQAVEGVVALACARDSMDSVIKAVDVLLDINNDVKLNVTGILTKALRTDYEDRYPQVLDVHNHVGGFHFNTRKHSSRTLADSGKGCDCKEAKWTILTSQNFILVSNSTGCRLAKIGTGYGNTIRGFVYGLSNKCLGSGLFFKVDGVLIHRPWAYDDQPVKFGSIIDLGSLEPIKELNLVSTDLQLMRENITITIQSRNNQFVWLRTVTADSELLTHLPQGNILVLDFGSINMSDNGDIRVVGMSSAPRKILLKNPEATENLNKVLKILSRKPNITNPDDMTSISDQQQQQHVVRFPADSNSTTCGLRIGTLQESTIIACDQFLTVLSPSPDSSRGKGVKNLGSAVSFDLDTGILQSQVDIVCDPAQASPSLPRGYSILSAAITYDPKEHKFWSVTYNRVDEFDGVLGLEPGACLRQRLIGSKDHRVNNKDYCPRLEAISHLLEHAAIRSLRLKNMFSLTNESLLTLAKVMKTMMKDEPMLGVTAINVIAGYTFGNNDSNAAEVIASVLDHAVEALLTSCDTDVIKEIIKLRSRLGQNPQSISDITSSLNKAKVNCNLPALYSMVRQVHLEALFEGLSLCKFKDDDKWTLLYSLCQEEILSNVQDITTRCLEIPSPDKSSCSLWKNKGLDIVTAIASELGYLASSSSSDPKMLDLFSKLTEFIIGSCNTLLNTVIHQVSTASKDLKSNADGIQCSLQASILDPSFLGPILSCNIQLLQGGESHVLFIELFCKCCKLLNLLEQQSKQQATKEQCLETSLPWVFTHLVETPHPVKEGFKIQETVKLPGAKCLYIIFDKKCSTMTDSDRLALYEGSSMTCKKILDCGGNASPSNVPRRIGQRVWPKKPVLIMGDSVTIDFEAKNKQDSDPTSTVSWGLSIAIGHCPADILVSSNMSVLENVALSLSPLICHNIAQQFEGNPPIPEEKQCAHLLNSKILQGCNWRVAKVEQQIQLLQSCPQDEIMPPLSLVPNKTVNCLRRLTGLSLPIMRESIKKLVQPQLLEEAIVSAIIKHMRLEDTVASYLQDEDPNTPDGCLLHDVMLDVYLRISSLVRKLQTIAELESKWNDEVDNLREGCISLKEVFFQDYLHHESKTTELSLLCFLKHIDTKAVKPQKVVQELKKVLEIEASQQKNKDGAKLVQTTALVKGIFCRLDLLIRADIDGGSNSDLTESIPQLMSMSLQNWPAEGSAARQMKRQQSNDLEKALDDSILQITKLQRSVLRFKQSRSFIETSTTGPLLDLTISPEAIVNELFVFIGNSPDDSVPGTVFLIAMLERLHRCKARSEALKDMKTVIKAAEKLSSISKHVIASMAAAISIGLRSDELSCSKNVTKGVLGKFSSCLNVFVDAAARYPLESHAILGFLCIIPFGPAEDDCIVQSGLLKMLDELSDHSKDLHLTITESQALPKVAWLGFKLLAKRCVLWETSQDESEVQKSVSLLQKQVSKLLSNHLMQAVGCDHRALGLEAVQEAIELLRDLAQSQIGKGILSQPACVSKLFLFLLDPNLSPHMTLTLILLLQVALPNISTLDCNEVELPPTFSNKDGTERQEEAVVQVLMSKLAHLMTPDTMHDQANEDPIATHSTSGPAPNDIEDDAPLQAVFVHRRPDQSVHELIQQLLNASTDIGILSSMSSDSMEKVIRIDKEINQNNIAEVISGDATRIYRAATKMAQLGFVVSISSPNQFHDSSSGWRHRSTQVCAERNNMMAKSDPARPFISSGVANKLSTEIIVLFHRLAQSDNSKRWISALQTYVHGSVIKLPDFLQAMPLLRNLDIQESAHVFEIGKKVTAALAILGGFNETMKVGSQVKIKGAPDSPMTDGIVKAIHKEATLAIVMAHSKFAEDPVDIEVSLKHLEIVDSLQGASKKWFVTIAKSIVPYLQAFLLPSHSGVEPLCMPLPTMSCSTSISALSRLIAEVRSRACQVMGLHMDESTIAKTFLQLSCQSVDMLKYFSKECQPSDKLCCSEHLCEQLRGHFKDQARPTNLSLPSMDLKREMQNQWNTAAIYPPIKSVIFMHKMAGVTYLGTPITSIGLPRGVVLNSVLPLHSHNGSDASFTVHILSLGEGFDDSGAPTISIGLSPLSERREGAWNHPDGALFLHSNGRVVHYKGTNLLSWKSTRVDHLLSPGDKVTVKWLSRPQYGSIQFMVNDAMIGEEIENVSADMFPSVHIQQRGVRIRATFSTALQSTPGPISNDSVDTALKSTASVEEDLGGGHRRQHLALSRQAVKLRAKSAYDQTLSSTYRLPLYGYPGLKTGCKVKTIHDVLGEEDEDEDEDDDDFDEFVDDQSENINALLVKSWEEKVFPAIRRRFRNESERRDGLEQIKGALSLGMIDIAKQTVEFLYEENGGVPADLKLPDFDDVKNELSTLSIDKLKTKTSVAIGEQVQQPLFACKQQMKTFGLEGEVLRTDVPNELVEVETYIEEDGTIVRYWYPIDCLKKTATSAKISRKKGLTEKKSQSDLLNCEFILSRLYCRQAYLALVKVANEDTSSLVLEPDADSEHLATLTSNILMLQDWDIETLLYIIDENTLPCHESIVAGGTELISPSGSLLQLSCTNLSKSLLSSTKYCQTIARLQQIFTTMQCKPSSLKDLVSEILEGLGDSQGGLPQELVEINAISMLASTIHFPNSSCVCAAIRFEKNMKVQHPEQLRVVLLPLESSPKHKALQHGVNQLVKYPSTIKGGKNIHLRSFPPAIFSTNALKVYHSGANESNTLLQLDGVPNKVLLALLMVEVLRKSLLKEETLFPLESYTEALDFLANFELKFEVVPAIKTAIFYSTAQLVNTMHRHGLKWQSKLTERLVEQIIVELGCLHESESKGTGKFVLHSMYCQSLLAVCVELHSLACYMALTIPKPLAMMVSSMDLLDVIKNPVRWPKDMVKNFPSLEVEQFALRYLVLTGIPRQLESDHIRCLLKKSLATAIHGLQTVEVYIPLQEAQQQGYAVVHLQASCMQNEVKTLIQHLPAFHETNQLDVHHETGTVTPLVVSKVRVNLQSEDPSSDAVWINFVKLKLLSEGRLLEDTKLVLNKIFMTSLRDPSKGTMKFTDLLLMKKSPFLTFLNGIKGRPTTDIRDDLRAFFKDDSIDWQDNEPEELSFGKVVGLVEKLCKEDVISVVRGFNYCGFDLDLKPMGSIANAEESSLKWTNEKDVALVCHLNEWCTRFNQQFLEIVASEFSEEFNELTPQHISVLQGLTEEEIRSRILLLKLMNSQMSSCVAPLVNFESFQGVACDLQSSKQLLFSSWKIQMLDKLLDATAEKDEDQPGVTITLNPLETIEQSEEDISATWFFQSNKKFTEFSSSHLCTTIPHSDDPQFPLVIKMTGEEVHGNSGSFRHFISRIVDELHGSALPLLMPYMGNGTYKGMYVLRPGPLQIIDEKLLIHLGQMLGIAVRSNIPLPINMIPPFWKGLLGDNISGEDLAVFDPDMERYLRDMEAVHDAEAFEIFLDHHQNPSMVCHSISGEEVELISGGKEISVNFSNRKQYMTMIRQFQMKEIQSTERIHCIMAGMSSILPMGFIQSLFTPKELEFRVCGSSDIDLNILKKYTLYQVGISEEDRHIQDFWSVLFSLNSLQLRMFVKFACNQERIPRPQDSNNLPPPYPMKIAPADARDEAQDNLLIRAETCIFMVKIPRYSTFDVMRQKIIYSIHAAEDPLSG